MTGRFSLTAIASPWLLACGVSGAAGDSDEENSRGSTPPNVGDAAPAPAAPPREITPPPSTQVDAQAPERGNAPPVATTPTSGEGLGDAGVSSGYDPGVTFDWPEAVPNAGDCQAGVYVGEFFCQFVDPTNPTQAPVDVSGPVSFTLEESTNGEFLEIVDGRLDGSAFILLPFTAELAGELQCASNELQAQAVNGFSPITAFDGTLEGTLDRATQTLSGTWSLRPATAAAGTCDGTWSAARQP